MMRTVFERTWRSDSRWKRRFYARYMTWLERIGYAVVLLLLGGFILAFNYKVDDVVKAEGVTLEAASTEIVAPGEGRIIRVLKEDFAEVNAGDVIMTMEPGTLEIRSTKAGILRVSADMVGKAIKADEVLAKVADYGKLVAKAKLKGESIAMARVGQNVTLTRVKIDDSDKTILRGQVGESPVLSRRALGSDLRADLNQSLKGVQVQTRNDVPLTIEEVTEVEVDANLKGTAASGSDGLELDPGPDFKLSGQIISGDHILTAQIADLPPGARNSADALVAKSLQGLSLAQPGGSGLKIDRADEPRYLVKVKARLPTDSNGTPKVPVLQGTAIDRYFDATIQLTNPPEFLVRKLREADRRGQAITATIEVRTGSKPLAFTLLKRS